MIREEVVDHLGNVYPDLGTMCTHYGVPISRFKSRRSRGIPLERALSSEKLDTPRRAKSNSTLRDHLGNAFTCTSEMCKYWRIPLRVLRQRIVEGYTLEQALTLEVPKKEPKRVRVFDHEGNSYETIVDMCRRYGVTYVVYKGRIKLGWGLKEALLGKPFVVDHLGNRFKSTRAMCTYHGVIASTFNSRVRAGRSLEEALTSPVGVTDHLGNVFSTKLEMCKHYGVPYSTYMGRCKSGEDLKSALMGSLKVLDHLGNAYATKEELCRHYGLLPSCVRGRLKSGWGLEKALTTKPQRARKYHPKPRTTKGNVEADCFDVPLPTTVSL